MSEKREITQDHLDGMSEAFKIANIYGIDKSITDKEMADLLANVTIKAPDKSREIQIDAINKTKEVQALNVELDASAKLAENLAVNLQKLGVNFLSV
jgi:hypothetical protein